MLFVIFMGRVHAFHYTINSLVQSASPNLSKFAALFCLQVCIDHAQIQLEYIVMSVCAYVVAGGTAHKWSFGAREESSAEM